ncbi:MAG: DNA polymerase I [Kiritimatiellae bacterium]|nr:DNA polymerase I [Kiritimatiellia bacterium]
MKKSIFIIDLMPFLYKGHFVFLRSPRMTSTGLNVSALIGFVNGITSILGEYKPTHAVLAMDPGGPTFRHTAYPPYKAQREKMPEDLAANIPYAFEVAEALGLPVVRQDGFEADDVMGTLAVKAAAEGFEVYCATPDKDAAQLVRPHIHLFRPGHGKDGPEIYDEAKVQEHWSLSSPAQMIDYLALAGDTADNIPGIRGVGEKTATTLLAQYGTVEGILAHAGELKGKLAEKVAAGAEDAKMSKFLTTIRTDVPLEVDWNAFARGTLDAEKVRAVCTKFELRQLAKRLLGETVEIGAGTVTVPVSEAGETAPVKTFTTLKDWPHTYTLVKTAKEAQDLAWTLLAAPKFAFDTETTGTNAQTADLVGMSFATEPGKAWYVAVPPHRTGSGTAAAPADDLFASAAALEASKPAALEAAKAFVQIFAPAFADPSKTLIAQNAKFDRTMLGRYGITFGSKVRDTMLEHYVIDAAARHDMDTLAREFLDYNPIPITQLIGEKERGKEQKNMADLSPEEILDYAAEDADVTLRLDAVLRPKVVEAGALAALEQSEEPLVPILVEMEQTGVKIDTAALEKFGIELGREIAAYATEIRASAGMPDLNIDSPKQLADLLYGKLGLKPVGAKKTQTGQFSTDEKALQSLVDAHPVIRKILEYRACTKLKGTYVDKLPRCIDRADGRVHTTFAQAFTETGRLSSSDPNLQNIPVRTDRGKLIRAAIVARDADHVLVSADYSQIELRIMAAMSGDQSMLAAFAQGADIHRETAARVYDVMPPLVTDDMRRKCKMVNFGIIYGISSFGLAQRLQVARKEAAGLIDTYFKLYPKIRAFMDTSIAKARDAGYAVTALGRRRTLRDIASRNATARQGAERDAINTPVQGTAADLIKLAMVKVDRALKAAGLQAKMILQIHDELLFDVPKGEVEQVKEIVKREMEGAMSLGVPLEVSVGVGANWLDAH